MNLLNPSMPPRYVINPVAAPLKWSGEIFQMLTTNRNRSYLNSLWLGTAWNTFNLPYRFCKEPLKLFFMGQFRMAASAMWWLPTSFVKTFWHGICGKLVAVNMTIDQAINCIVMTNESGQEAINVGVTDHIVDMHNLQASMAAP